MKILTVSSTEITDIGGVNYSIKRVAEELVKHGHECQVLNINPGNLPHEENINGINVIRIKSPISKHLYQFSPEMAQFLQRNLGGSLKPDIIHLHEYRRLLTPAVAYIVRNKHLPFIFSAHYSRQEYNTLAGKYLLDYYKPIGKKLFDWAEMIVIHSDYTKMVLMQDFNVQSNKIKIITPGVDYLMAQDRGVLKGKASSISLLYAGVLMEKKGVHHIILALKELKRRGREACLTIVGKGDYEPKLRRLACKLGIEGDVFWHKPLPRHELHRKLMEADIVLLLSRAEAYGVMVTEALAAGTPCIVTKTTSLNEFLTEPGCFGIDYPPVPGELANLIVKIRDSETIVGPFSTRIRTWDRVADDYERIYEQVI